MYMVHVYIHSYESCMVCKLANFATVCMYILVYIICVYTYMAYIYIHTYKSSTECKLANVATVCMYTLVYIICVHICCTYVHTLIRIIYGVQARQRCECVYTCFITYNTHIYILYIGTYTHMNHEWCASSPTLQLYVYIYRFISICDIYCIYVHTHIESSTVCKHANAATVCMYIYISILVYYMIYIVYMYIHTYESSTVCKHANAATVCMYTY